MVAGAEIVVTGRHFSAGCPDYAFVPSGGGCSGPRPRSATPPAAEPLRDVRLHLERDGRSWQLGRADAAAGENYEIEWRVRLPADVAPGKATLVATPANQPGESPIQLDVTIVTDR
jgi:hypothetical protein